MLESFLNGVYGNTDHTHTKSVFKERIMTIIDKKLDKPLRCSCGNDNIDHISIGYGSTPYMIHCHECKCDFHKVLPGGIGGQMQNAIDAWNDYHEIVTLIKEKNYTPTADRIRGAMYKKMKWGINP